MLLISGQLPRAELQQLESWHHFSEPAGAAAAVINRNPFPDESYQNNSHLARAVVPNEWSASMFVLSREWCDMCYNMQVIILSGRARFLRRRRFRPPASIAARCASMQRCYKEFIPVFHTFVIGLHTHTHTYSGRCRSLGKNHAS